MIVKRTWHRYVIPKKVHREIKTTKIASDLKSMKETNKATPYNIKPVR